MLETIRNFDGSLLIKFQHLAVHDSLTPVVKVSLTSEMLALCGLRLQCYFCFLSVPGSMGC